MVAAALIAPPGPDVLIALTSLDHATLSDAVQVDLLAALERQSAWLAAWTMPILAGVGDRAQAAVKAGGGSGAGSDLSARAAHTEIAVTLRVSESVAANRLLAARDLTRDLPAVHAALAAGEISLWHAVAISDSTLSLTVEQRRWVADRILSRARRQTVTQLRRCLRRAVLHVAPEQAADRAAKANAERKVDFWPLPDGMAELRLIASASEVLKVYGTIDTLAHQHARGHPVGSPGWMPIAARRADALIDLILGTGTDRPGTIKTTLELTMDLPTLLGVRDNPAELTGYGPLPAPLARALAGDASWRRLIYEPLTGRLLDLGHTSHDPSEPLARHIRARERVCSVPTCNRPARRCHLNHARPYNPNDPNGGRTDAVNCGPLCGSHHRLKHETDWTLQRNPHTGDATWTTPTGHQHPLEPHDYRPLPMDDLPAEPGPLPQPEFLARPTPDQEQHGTWYITDDPDAIPDPTEETHHHETDAYDTYVYELAA